MDSASAPTVDLSGGYDSTALALLAAQRLYPERSVTGVTLHPEGVLAGGDMTYAHQAAKHPGIVHRLMALGFRHTPYSSLDAVPATDEPAPSTIAYGYFSAQLQWMRAEFGSDCHMTGDGGDSLLCSPPIMLADLMAARRYRRALVEAIEWARLRRVAVWPLVVEACRTVRTTRADALHTLARRWRTGHNGRATAGIGWVPDTTIPQWSTVDARYRAAGMAAATADRDRPMLVADAAIRVTCDVMARVGRTARADVQLAEWHGVPLHNPFTDSRLMDAYVAVPLDERPGPAEFKPLMREALADLFPASLAARRTKGSFTADYYQGMRANLLALHGLADGWLAELGLVNPAVLRRTLTAASAGVPVAFPAVEPAIAAEVWLRALGSTPTVEWMPAAQTGYGPSQLPHRKCADVVRPVCAMVGRASHHRGHEHADRLGSGVRTCLTRPAPWSWTAGFHRPAPAVARARSWPIDHAELGNPRDPGRPRSGSIRAVSRLARGGRSAGRRAGCSPHRPNTGAHGPADTATRMDCSTRRQPGPG